MTTGTDGPGAEGNGVEEANGGHPNVSPELQDAIRSIDAIGENAWGKDDDEDAPRQGTDSDSGSAAQPTSEPDASQP